MMCMKISWYWQSFLGPCFPFDIVEDRYCLLFLGPAIDQQNCFDVFPLFKERGKRHYSPCVNSMTIYLESDDLLHHIFHCIEKGDRQSATLVCKRWKGVSYGMPTWRKARLDRMAEDGT